MVAMETEPPPLTNKKPRASTPTFGDLVRAVRVWANGPYQYPLMWRQAQEQQTETMKLCDKWREEQFQWVVEKRQVQLA